MNANLFNVNDRVVRLDGGIGYAGMTGTVVEVTESRCRVKWDDQTFPNFYRPEEMTTRPGKRTWVKFTSLRKMETVLS